MIYITCLAESETDASLIFDKQNNNIQLKVDNDLIKFKLIDRSKLSCPELVHYGWSHNRGIYQFTNSEARESRSGLPFAIERNGGHSNGSISSFMSVWYSLNEYENLSIFCNGNVTVYCDGYDQSEYKVVEGYYSANKLFAEILPEAKAYFQRSDAKRNLVQKINELDSLTMIESQLDLLTRYVLTGEGKESLQSEVEDNMTTSIHSDEKLIQTIQRQKSYLRNLQKQYFEQKGSFESGSISS